MAESPRGLDWLALGLSLFAVARSNAQQQVIQQPSSTPATPQRFLRHIRGGLTRTAGQGAVTAPAALSVGVVSAIPFFGIAGEQWVIQAPRHGGRIVSFSFQSFGAVTDCQVSLSRLRFSSGAPVVTANLLQVGQGAGAVKDGVWGAGEGFSVSIPTADATLLGANGPDPTAPGYYAPDALSVQMTTGSFGGAGAAAFLLYEVVIESDDP